MSKRDESIEHAVRIRLAEALTAQGVGYHRVSLEILYLLPPEFVDAYTQLFYRAFRDDASIRVGDPDAAQVKDNRQGQKRGSGKAVPQGKKYRQHWQIGDEKAFARKQLIDRELRALVRKMAGGEKYEDRARRRCKGCGRWVEMKWDYCAYCGSNLKEKDK